MGNKHNKREQKVIEISKDRPRKEEEKFFAQFSERQLNSILLVILAETFLVQGVVRYLESLGRIEFIKPWFFMVIPSLIFLIISVFSISLGGVVIPLKFKRETNKISFVTFVGGFSLFLISLFYVILVV